MPRFFAILILLLSLSLAQSVAPVATNLNGPMGVLVAPDGSVYVVDSGTGGPQEISIINPETGKPAVARVGNTSRILKIDRDGKATVVATLPSMALEMDSTGGSRLALVGNTLYATSGAWNLPDKEPLPLLGSVVRVNGNKAVEVANIWKFEKANNPDKLATDAHPYGIAAGPDRMLYVADAGANALFKVNPASGQISVVAVFAGLPSPVANPARGGAKETDPVPTGVAVAKDGAVYVSLLPGFPFATGSAKVVKVDAKGVVSDYATGLTALTDLQVGPDGNLYAIQMAVFTDKGPTPNTGEVVRIKAGKVERVLKGLAFPTAIALASNGDAYVTINGVGAPGSGQVHRFAGLAKP